MPQPGDYWLFTGKWPKIKFISLGTVADRESERGERIAMKRTSGDTIMHRSIHSTSDARVRAAREEYELGLAFYQRKQWKTAARHFAEASRKSGHDDVYTYLYMSYHGVCLVKSDDISGLNLCRRAASMETIQSAVFLNLAMAELKLSHRKRAFNAVQIGLNIDHNHPGLQQLRQTMGVRRPPCLPFLKRDNPLNRWLGRYTWQRMQAAL